MSKHHEPRETCPGCGYFGCICNVMTIEIDSGLPQETTTREHIEYNLDMLRVVAVDLRDRTDYPEASKAQAAVVDWAASVVRKSLLAALPAPGTPERPDDTWLREGGNGDVADWCAWAERRLVTLEADSAWALDRKARAQENEDAVRQENEQLEKRLQQLTEENQKMKTREFTIADAWQDGWDRAVEHAREIEKPLDTDRDDAWVEYYRRLSPSPTPEDESDRCPRCGGSFEATGGRPHTPPMECQACWMQDLSPEEPRS